MPIAPDKDCAQHYGRRDFLISLAGAMTTLTIIALNLLISRTLNFNLLSLSYWFVLPLGAFLGGLGAASGYYYAAKLTHTMPSRRILVDMVLVGGFAWFSYHWLDYYTLRLDDGTSVRDMLSFADYFVFKAEHSKLALTVQYRPVAGTGELGALGFVRELIQFFGFLAGGLAAYVFLMGAEVCEQCRRYTKNATLLYGASVDTVDEVLAQGQVTLPGIVEQAQEVLGKRPLAGFDLTLSRCPERTTEWLRPSVVIPAGNSFDRIRLSRYEVESDVARELQEIAKRVVAAAKSDPKRAR